MFVAVTPEFGSGMRATPTIIAWDALCFVTAGWLTATAVGQDMHIARCLSDIGSRIEIDLLQPDHLVPFARWSLRAVLLWVVYFSIMSLFFLVPEPSPLNAAGSIPLLVVSVVILVLPIRGLHTRLRAAKQGELAWINAKLRTERDRLRTGTTNDATIANLAAYRSLVEHANEWPIDASAVARFLLYTALGVASWLGGAIVERTLDTFVP